MRLTFVVVADVPSAGVTAFQRYEALVLPLLSRHDGRLERRLRGQDGLTEVHIVSFGSESGYRSYLADPERQAHHRLLVDAGVSQRLLAVTDVAVS